ncbi:hypothetical protein [Elizabethkingia phage TCUEAP1]|nr:hypothetical protein [Elizabethkingia phage TCUEAP1]
MAKQFNLVNGPYKVGITLDGSNNYSYSINAQPQHSTDVLGFKIPEAPIFQVVGSSDYFELEEIAGTMRATERITDMVVLLDEISTMFEDGLEVDRDYVKIRHVKALEILAYIQGK